MHFLVRVGMGLVAHTVFYKMTKNRKVSAASTALLYLLTRSVDEVAAAEVPTPVEQLTSTQIEKYYVTKGDTIFIQYPGLKIWFPQVAREKIQQITGGPINIETIINKARE